MTMLVQSSSLPSSFDAGLSSVPDRGKQEIVCVWISDDGSWEEHPQPGPQPQNVDPIVVTKRKSKDDSLCSRNLLSSSQLSTEANMSDTCKPNCVYKRRIDQKNDVLPPSQSCTPILVYKRKKAKKNVFPAQVSSNTRESDNGFSTNMVNKVKGSVGDEIVIQEPKGKMGKCAVNESCSSSKLNVDPGSGFLKYQVDDVGECSSSGVLVSGKDVLEMESFLQNHGVFERLFSTKKQKTGDEKNSFCCLKSCKVCGGSTTTLEMIICDSCEDSFHVFCCNPSLKKVPVGDWFCHSCLRKKLKKMKEISSSKSSKGYSGPIASILRNVGPYKTNVRIGKDFQAEVPEWSGPLSRDLNDYNEPIEISPSECATYQNLDSRKIPRFSSIGNWLQCRGVIDYVSGTICGKWRRAPLFEVQTDDWECFSSVLWDPTHADCAVPQELDTDLVLKQLKYVEMLRPKLSTKRWKLGGNKGVDGQGDATNT